MAAAETAANLKKKEALTECTRLQAALLILPYLFVTFIGFYTSRMAGEYACNKQRQEPVRVSNWLTENSTIDVIAWDDVLPHTTYISCPVLKCTKCNPPIVCPALVVCPLQEPAACPVSVCPAVATCPVQDPVTCQACPAPTACPKQEPPTCPAIDYPALKACPAQEPVLCPVVEQVSCPTETAKQEDTLRPAVAPNVLMLELSIRVTYSMLTWAFLGDKEATQWVEHSSVALMDTNSNKLSAVGMVTLLAKAAKMYLLETGLGRFKQDQEQAKLLGQEVFPFLQHVKEQLDPTSHEYRVVLWLLGFCHRSGFGIETDRRKAVNLYTTAAEGGLAAAQNSLAQCYEKGKGVNWDIAKACKWYSEAAEQGYVRAQFALGSVYARCEGKVLPENEEIAVELITKAAEQGLKEAQYKLGTLYAIKQGVDKQLAVDWYARAAEQGHIMAKVDLGNRYVSNVGVSVDYVKAVELFTQAATEGNENAMRQLGWCYYHAIGVQHSFVKAVEWYTKAVEKGDRVAMLYLAECAEYGKGTAIDLALAKRLYGEIAPIWPSKANEALERIEKAMAPPA
ncbi:hypothetical protein EON63_05060 [archaeon]|nr:MAG: hypothetical protein EON63_05060 [archaeon]